MKCPFCNAELKDDILFCDKCGQSVSNLSKNTNVINKYWTDVKTLNNANEKELENASRKAKSKAKARLIGVIIKIIIVAAVVIVLGVSATILNADSQQKLEFIKSDAIGNTYSDTSGFWVTLNGDKRNRIIVTIKDGETLAYTRGNYTIRMSEGSTKWIENEIYESCDYKYTFSSSLFGKITIEFNGKKYNVVIDEDDGTIRYIDFYDN